MSRFLDYEIRIYDLKNMTTQRAVRVVAGYPKDKVNELFDQQKAGEKDYTICVNQLHTRECEQLHLTFISLGAPEPYLQERVMEDFPMVHWIEPDYILPSGICVWRMREEFSRR
jgi:hypothetical protein